MPHHYTSRSLVHLEKSLPRDHETFGPAAKAIDIVCGRTAPSYSKAYRVRRHREVLFYVCKGWMLKFCESSPKCLHMSNFATPLLTHIFHHRGSQRPEQALQ